MKYILLIPLLAFVGCDYSQNKSKTFNGHFNTHEQVIDGCEYIVVKSNGISIVHKANCKNHD